MSTMAGPADRPLRRVGRFALAGILVGGMMLAATDQINPLFFVGYASVGALLVIRRPSSAIGWLLLVIAFAFIGTTARPGTDAEALLAGTATAAQYVFAWVSSWAGYASYLAFFSLVVLFPSGHLPTGRWRRPTEACLAIGVALVILTAVAPTFTFNVDGGVTNVVIPNRFAILPWLSAWTLLPADGSVTFAFVLVILGMAVVSMIVRYRRATGVVRLQLRWFVSAMVFVLVAVALGLGGLAVFGDLLGNLAWIPAVVAFPTVPLAIGIAITRYRLYEIDRIISRTLGWAVVTGVLLAVFALGVVGLQAVLTGFTQGQTLAVAASTLAAFALFQPLRRHVQHAVDRRFDRARYDGAFTADEFAARVRDEVDIDAVVGDFGTTVSDAMRPRALGIWLRGAGR